MEKIVCFGEIMLRLNPPGYERFVHASTFEASYAGAEANVAVSLANLGMEASFVSKVPSHQIGQSAINELRRYGVDTRYVLRGGERLGVYYVEKGASQRPSTVIYDRANSAIATLEHGEFNWAEILQGASWLHFTGITPALSTQAEEECFLAVREAKKQGVRVSCDLNYRKKLWSREKANRVMSALMPFIDLCIANEEDASDVFGIHAADSDINASKLDREGYVSVAKQLSDRFGLQAVAITLRGSLSASDNTWSGMLYKDGIPYFAPEYMLRIVDRLGGGDSFAAALLYALTKHFDPEKAIHFAVAASCLKHSQEHDFNLISVQEALSLLEGNASGRVRR